MRNFLNLDVSHLWACLRHRSNLPAEGLYTQLEFILLSTPVVLSFDIFMPVLGITAIPVVITKDLFG